MKTVKILMLQSWFDISVKYTGSALNAFEISKYNNQSITDEPTVNSEIIIPDNLPTYAKELQYFKDRDINPATGLTIIDKETIIPPEGIDYMIIENNFIVY
jgi:hypothetical protein